MYNKESQNHADELMSMLYTVVCSTVQSAQPAHQLMYYCNTLYYTAELMSCLS